MPYFGEPVGRVKIQTTSKNSQRYYITKRLIRDLLSNTPNCYVRRGGVGGGGGGLREYLFTGECVTEVCEAERNWHGQFSKLIGQRQETCLTGPLEYKYRVIFVLVLGVIYTLRGAAG